MSRPRIKEYKASPRYEVLDPQSQDELESILTDMYPNNIIPAGDILNGLSNVSRAVIKSDLGVRNFYTPKELAAYFWQRSNYNAIEQDPYSAYF
ncbi:hypothetical protein WAX87_11050 [Photobacterium damselae subsp. damselae]|uniref:hypothetical protein n=1 Tax=Photobacterium damselae TaxID=38293 RepID=UPI00311ADC13